MNEIEKLYKLAEVQPQYKKRIECKEGYRVGQPCGKCPCINCDKSIFEDVMPPFTADKQLELIKLLQRKNGYKFSPSSTNDNSEYLFFAHKDGTPVQELIVAGDKCYEEALASFINTLWQDLTSEEKEQVRGILK